MSAEDGRMRIAGVDPNLIGAVRRGPQGHGVVRISNVGEDDWLMLGAGSDPLYHRYTDGRVWNWPVVGVVPGTPASWRAGEPLFEQDDEARDV